MSTQVSSSASESSDDDTNTHSSMFNDFIAQEANNNLEARIDEAMELYMEDQLYGLPIHRCRRRSGGRRYIHRDRKQAKII